MFFLESYKACKKLSHEKKWTLILNPGLYYSNIYDEIIGFKDFDSQKITMYY